jgi:hypothetical protein
LATGETIATAAFTGRTASGANGIGWASSGCPSPEPRRCS